MIRIIQQYQENSDIPFDICINHKNIEDVIFKDVIDYVVLHELCHTKVMNHSKEFYKLVSEYMPSYKESQKRLKEIIIPAVIEEKGI